ncbi:trehalose-6-phosphate synthase, partial [Gemmata sp. JC717]|nr:trehalose-6-phosphate synthase [Gemmata algarum]
DHNIYRWAGMLLSEVGKRVPDSPPMSAEKSQGEREPDPNLRAAADEEAIARETYVTAMQLAGA